MVFECVPAFVPVHVPVLQISKPRRSKVTGLFLFG
jgi:hypothetical protein